MDVMHAYALVAPFIMVALVLIFAAIFGWAYWPKHKRRFDEIAQIPLRDGD